MTDSYEKKVACSIVKPWQTYLAFMQGWGGSLIFKKLMKFFNLFFENFKEFMAFYSPPPHTNITFRFFFLPPPMENLTSETLFTLSECYENWHANYLGYDKHIWSSWLTL